MPWGPAALPYGAICVKNGLKRKSATLEKYGGKLENGRPKIFHGMCGVIFCWTDGEGPG